MDENIHIDTGLLREHVSVILEEKRIAEQLLYQVEKLRKLSSDSVGPQYNAIVKKIENLIQYYRRMAEALETLGDDAVMLYREIAQKLQDDNDKAKRDISNFFML